MKASRPNPRNYFLESRITIFASLGVTTNSISMCSSTMPRKWSIYSNRFLKDSTGRHHSELSTIACSDWFFCAVAGLMLRDDCLQISFIS